RRMILRRAKAGASGLLAFAALVLIAVKVYGRHDVISGLIEAAAEAAIVGGLADWFAVTALFRHPLGLPIPHTALIPRRKNDIANSFGEFVSENFLAADLLIPRLRVFNLAAKLAALLNREDVLRFIGRRLAALVPALIAGADDIELRGFVTYLASDAL